MLAKIKKILLAALLLLKISYCIYGQIYPVQTNLFLIPPYSAYQTDYADPASNKLKANIILNDRNQSSITIYLKIGISSDKLQIHTKPGYRPMPVTLYSGIPLQLDGTDLSTYFNTENLIIEGQDAQNFISKGKLSEGVYTFTLEVYEYYRNVKISNTGIAIAMILQNEAPRMLNPVHKETLIANEPQYIFFKWFQQLGNDPQVSFNTEFEFKLAEYLHPGLDPTVAIQNTNPLYTETTSQSFLLYGPDKPALIPGKQYICQVRAIDKLGKEDFKNDGYSETVLFKFGEECQKPRSNQIEEVNSANSLLSWIPESENTSFQIEVRENDDELSEWYTYRTNENEIRIDDLNPSTEYEYRMKSICRFISSDYTLPANFITKEIGQTVYNCNDELGLPEISNSIVLLDLKVGDIIEAGGFYVKISEVEQTDEGEFKGKCIATLALWDVNINCSFENLRINNAYQLLSGKIKALHAQELTIINTEIPTLPIEPNIDINPGTIDIEDFEIDTIITITVPIDTVYTEGDITIIVTEGGDQIEIDANDDILIVTTDEEIIVVESGEVIINPPIIGSGDTENPETESIEEAITEKKVRVDYSPDLDLQLYGYDKRNANEKGFDPMYEKTKVQGQDYFIDWKSIESYKFDHVDASIQIEDTSSKYSDIKFNSEYGEIPALLKDEEGKYSLFVNGLGDNSTGKLIASYAENDSIDNAPEIKAGELNLISYDKDYVKLCIVNVDEAKYPYSINELEFALNQIFAPAIVDVSVTTRSLEEVDWDLDGNKRLSAEESGILSTYNDEMKAIKNAIRDAENYDENTYYLFLINESDKETLSGYMPLKRQFGFIFMEKNKTKELLYKTIAHELSHGCFNLRHTFSSENLFNLPQGSTENLMDYNTTKTELKKYQWDYIHDPENLIGLFQDEEEGALVNSSSLITHLLDSIHNANDNSIRKIDFSNLGTKVYHGKSVKLQNNNTYEIAIVTKLKNGKNEVNIGKGDYGTNKKNYAMARKGDFTVFELYSAFYKTFEIIVETKYSGTLETYLFNDTILEVNIVTNLIVENERNTFSSFNIDNGGVNGYFIERESGTTSEQRTEGSLKRIPEEEYEVIENDCNLRPGYQIERPNCANEFRLVTTLEKSGTRSGILIHRGTDYNDTEGCLIPVGIGYSTRTEEIIDNDSEVSNNVTIYQSNGTTETALNAINAYIEQKKQEAISKNKTIKINININR